MRVAYVLGIDLGTTFSAAAVSTDDRAEIVSLGDRAPQIPSVVLLRDDGEVLVGDAAERRGVTEPTRTAREFKRRLGDPTPLLLGGTPYGAEALMGHLLESIVRRVVEQRGERPESIVISHPANWGPYKRDLLRDAVRIADLDDVTFVSEPVAAAVHYALRERIEPGEHVAVYDLGGGTFDAAVLRRTADGFTILGSPEGMERLGGIDFDEAVFAHVRAALGDALEQLDPADPSALAAVARLREECRTAKEALSSDTDANIPVLLPNVHTEIRVTRADFEQMIRPRIGETITTLQRAVRSAGLGMEELSKVLLVGGSSRIPLVAQMVREATGRPVAIDAHPKFAIAIGAALMGGAGEAATTLPAPTEEPAVIPVVAPPEAAPVEAATPTVEAEPPAVPPPAAPAPPAGPKPTRGRPSTAVLAGIAAAIVLAIVLVAVLAGGGGGGGDDEEPDDAAAATVTTESPTTTTPTTATTVPARPSGPYTEISRITRSGDTYVVAFSVAEFDPQISPTAGTRHIHFFWNTLPPENAGTNGNPPGEWVIYDGPSPFTQMRASERPSGATQICARVADHQHAVFADTGNCVDLPD